MKQQEVFKKIGGIIREINEQYDYLKTSGEVLNDLELELMVANSHFLCDHLEILRKVNAQAVAVQPPVADKPATPAQKPPAEKPVAPAPREAETAYLAPVQAEESVFEREQPASAENHTIEFEMGNKAETIRHELSIDDTGEDWDETEDAEAVPEVIIQETAPSPVAKQPVQQAPPVVPPHTQILVPEDQVITLNERMSAQMAPSRMGDQLNAQPITDLKTAITLNDKLLYIKDLFNGYSLAYSEAIELLNKMSTFEEAESFLKNSYATKNNWADKTITADKFYALLQRRYS